MSVAVKSLGGAAGWARARLRGRHDEYAFCANDGHFFRPLYTGGKCPLCGEEAISGCERTLPWLMRFDRFRFGMTVLIAVWLVMSALVLVVYFD